MGNGTKTLNSIHRNLWKKSQEEDPFGQVERDQIRIAIEEEAGVSSKTFKRYFDALQRHDKIEQDRNLRQLGRWKVKEPDAEVKMSSSGKKEQTLISLDTEIKRVAKSNGLNISTVTEKAIAEALGERRDFVNRLIGGSYTDEETEFMYKLVIHDLYSKAVSTRQSEADRQEQRKELYTNVFDVDEVSQDDVDRIEALRKRAFNLAEELGIHTV